MRWWLAGSAAAALCGCEGVRACGCEGVAKWELGWILGFWFTRPQYIGLQFGFFG